VFCTESLLIYIKDIWQVASWNHFKTGRVITSRKKIEDLISEHKIFENKVASWNHF
jgi:hypothetical protein